MSNYRRRAVSGVGLFGNPKAVLYDRDVGIDHARNAGNRKATTHRYHGKREEERAAKRLAKQRERETAADMAISARVGSALATLGEQERTVEPLGDAYYDADRDLQNETVS